MMSVIMRRFIHTFITVSILSCLAISCGKLGGASVSLKTGNEMQATAAGGYLNIAFSAKGDWTATSSAGWCTVSPASGSASDNISLKVTCEPNEGVDARTSSIVIKCGDGMETVAINQDAKATFVEDVLNYNIDYKEQNVVIDFQTNVEYEVVIDPYFASWITVVSTKGLHAGKVTIAVKENPSAEKRSGNLTIIPAKNIPDAGGDAILVNIFQGPKTYLNVEETSISLPAYPEYAYIDFNTNAEFEVKADDVDWLKYATQGEASEHHWITYYSLSNNTSQGRSCKVCISLKEDPNTKVEITITQTGTEETVDLGLSVLWRAFNVGASTMEDPGSYFAWGETATKSTYSWGTYKWADTDEGHLTKYCTDANLGNVDDKTSLESTDDAAAVILGNGWRIPTPADFNELVENTTAEAIAISEINLWGIKFTSKVQGYEGKTLYIVANGRYIAEQYNEWSFPMIWTSVTSKATDYTLQDDRYAATFPGNYGNGIETVISAANRRTGLPIRPVKAK